MGVPWDTHKHRFFVEKKPLESAFLGYNINNLVMTGDILQGILTKEDNTVFSDEETGYLWNNVNEGADTWINTKLLAILVDKLHSSLS